ncbi:MAG: nuclear transport factor 2 family protein [Haloferacaceae archaeon]
MDADPLDLVRAYYETIDAGEYDRLADLLAMEFVQRRPDRTLAGREAFVGFMREKRPRTDTDHAVDALYRRVEGDATDADAEVVARGRLLADDGSELFGFADAFAVVDGRLQSVRTYTA